MTDHLTTCSPAHLPPDLWSVYVDQLVKTGDTEAARALYRSGGWVLDAGSWMVDAFVWMLDIGYWMLDTEKLPLEIVCWKFYANLPIPFRRMSTLSLQARKMKFLFKKWLVSLATKTENTDLQT